jgi:hypothetical protein
VIDRCAIRIDPGHDVVIEQQVDKRPGQSGIQVGLRAHMDEDQVPRHLDIALTGRDVVEGPVQLGQEVVALLAPATATGPDLGDDPLDPVHGPPLEHLARGRGEKGPPRTDKGLGSVEPVQQRDQPAQVGLRRRLDTGPGAETEPVPEPAGLGEDLELPL